MKKNFKLLALVVSIMLLPQTDCSSQLENTNSYVNSGVSATDLISKTTVNIGTRLELFADEFLIEKLNGKAELRLHHPVPREIVIVHDAPWEMGNDCNYYCIFKDGNLFRMYHYANQRICYEESEDGINWRKPELGLVEFKGSKDNNIVISPEMFGDMKIDAASITMFKDENPNAAPDALYKAFFTRSPGGSSLSGLIPFKSPDGFHWSPMTDSTVISGDAFDSQNLAFWDSMHSEYRAYWRSFPHRPYGGSRSISTATSMDFLNWSNIDVLLYIDSPQEHMYTNVIKPYYRAPHLLIGFPTRYVNRGWTESVFALPGIEDRKKRGIEMERFGTAMTEALFMVSRDGVTFKRWNEAFLRPGIERDGSWAYGDNYIGWSMLETKSDLEGAPNELSFYAPEAQWTGTIRLRRYTLRIDGFVSVSAPMSGGELVTRLLIFNGSKLVLNFSSSAAGGIQVEVQDVNGTPVPGFTLNDCSPIFGDTIERIVTWKKGNDLSTLEGKPVRLRFVIKDADLFSLRFQ